MLQIPFRTRDSVGSSRTGVVNPVPAGAMSLSLAWPVARRPILKVALITNYNIDLKVNHATFLFQKCVVNVVDLYALGVALSFRMVGDP